MEYYLNQNLDVIYSDFTPNGLRKIKDLFPNIKIFCQNLMDKLDINEIDNVETAVMYRLSTEFSLKDHKNIFQNLSTAGIKYIVFVPTDVLNLKVFINEKKYHLYNIIHGFKDTFCGYIYSDYELNKMWKDSYIVERKVSIEKGNYIYFLKKRIK